jgi:hypothetical protein
MKCINYVGVALAALASASVVARAVALAAPQAGYALPGVEAKGVAEASSSPTTAAPSKSSTAAPAAATPAKLIPSPTINANVAEWVVFVADVSNPELNARNLFPDNLPPLVDDLRASRPEMPVQAYPSPYGRLVPDKRDEDSAALQSTERPKPGDPMPVGLIRFSAAGPLEKDSAVDVQVSYKNGRSLGHWPRAKVRSSGLLWQDLHLGEAKGEPRKLPEGSWVESLRSGGLPVTVGATRESFLLYDVELNYPLAMKVTCGKEGKYTVAQGTDSPLRDFTLYKQAADGRWQTASIPSLAKSAGVAIAAADTGTAAAGSSPADALGGAISSITGAIRAVQVARNLGAPAAAPAATGGSAKPSAAKEESAKPAAAVPATAKPTDVTLSAPSESDATVLSSWRAKLAEAGVSTGDQEIILKALARQALDPKRLTAIYRMDPAELDRILPLEVVPQPKKVSRIALVVVKGIDPSIGDELDEWVKKLGDPKWKTRESAMTALKKAGMQAKARLLEAAKSSDAEVAYRAEQLLAVLGVEPDQNTPTAAVAPALQIGGFF